MISIHDRIAGGLIGLLVGDALGVPYEFHPPTEIPEPALIEFTPPAYFRRAHGRIPPGTWSDDGAQALLLLASLLYCGEFNSEDLGRRLMSWYQQGYKAVDADVFDVGIQTGEAIRKLMAGAPAATAGRSDEYGNGNGSLMRVLPLALWHQGSDESLVQDAHAQSSVTHGHTRSQVCCALYCLWARRILQERADPWADAVRTLRDLYASGSPHQAELEFHIRPDDKPLGDGSGYVVDSLRSARWAVEQGNYEQVVKAAITLGRDTDTTACIAGGIAGLRDGIDAIPQRWRDELRGKELYESELAQLLARHNP